MNDIVQTVYSETGRHRARIVKISENAFRIDIERRYEGIDAGGINRGDFWAPINEWMSYTDAMPRALESAAENIRISDASG